MDNLTKTASTCEPGNRSARPGLLRTAAIGALAGIAATGAIAALMQLAPRLGFDPQARDDAGEPQVGSPEAATRAVNIGARALTGSGVPRGERFAATSAFQFAFGAGLGACYALAARIVPQVTAGRGTAAGGAIFALFDEVLVPATGLSGEPQDSGAKAHGGALGTHLVFGLVLESVRRALVRRWS